MRLITGSADQTVKLWNVQTGAQLYSFNFDSPARAVDFSVGDKLAVISTDPFMGLPSTIQVKCIANDPSERMSANFFFSGSCFHARFTNSRLVVVLKIVVYALYFISLDGVLSLVSPVSGFVNEFVPLHQWTL